MWIPVCVFVCVCSHVLTHLHVQVLIHSFKNQVSGTDYRCVIGLCLRKQR